MGYADQAREFLSDDDECSTSSENDDKNGNLVNNLTNDRNEKFDDDICLQVNLHNHRTDSPISQCASTRSSSPMPDQTPILDIDDETLQSKPIEIAPMAALDDDDDDDTLQTDTNLPMFIPEQPVLPDLRSNLKSLMQFPSNRQQTQLVHDIIQMRHLFNENNHDDEFLAIMHNPKIFEDILSADNDKRLELIKQANSVTGTFRPSMHLSNDNPIANDSLEHHRNTHKTSSVSKTNENTIDVNHFDINNILYQQTSMDSSSDDDDSQLLQTLSQIHNVINHDRPLSIGSNEYGNEIELFNEYKQTTLACMPALTCVNDTGKQSDEDEEEKNEKNNVIFYQNHNDVDGGDDKQKGKNEKKNDDREEKKAANTLPLTSFRSFSRDDSFSSYDSETSSSSSLTNLLSLDHHKESSLFSNQLNTDDLQIKTKINMTHHSSDEQQITANIFDPFDPITTTTTTTTNMFNNENSNQTLNNYNFDELWNQSIAGLDHPSDFTWQGLFGEKNKPNEDLRDYLHWLFQHIHESLPDIEFTSTQNLESIIQDIRMSKLPFEPMPSPPLHIDHTVSNPLLNAIQHQLFPIDESEQPYQTAITPQSMILYEVDENQDEQIQTVVDKLVGNTLEQALTEVTQPTNFIENFVDRILSDAIYQVYDEDQQQQQLPIENLASIISWHDQRQATDKQLPDPFDQQFDTVWSKHFQAPDDTITTDNFFDDDHQIVNDPWLTSSNTSQTNQSTVSFDRKFDDNNFMKYSITAPIFDDEIFQPEPTPNRSQEILKQQTEHDSPIQDDIFSTQATTSQLNSPEIESKLTSSWLMTANIADNEPWELEDHPSNVNENDLSSIENANSPGNFFSDSFQPNENSKQTSHKSVRINDQIENIEIINYPSNDQTDISTADLDIDDVTTNLPNANERMEASYVTINERDFQSERSYESVEFPPSKIADKNSPTTSAMNENIPADSTVDVNQSTMQNSFSNESVLLRSTSNDEINIDADEINGVIPCLIDNTQINIDAKSINPFKCVICPAGTLNGDNRTAVIVIYGCALPDHRLREYRYIMDQLFYYVYHKLNKIVINDYVLIYFHGATSKHRTPDLKFLRKCYQMINFRLRKNLRAVYVVHPTRWLRTVIALSRPFFSKKFYHKIHYLYTIAELERQFPNNRLSIPTAIEQYDEIYRTQ